MSSALAPGRLESANHAMLVARQLSNVVHDVNNLLQVIGGSAELLEASPADPEEVVRRASLINTHSRRASELLGAVQHFARGSRVDISAYDLQELVREALAMRHYALTKARIAVAVDPDVRPVHAMVNRRRTLQILLNVLIRAEESLAGRDGGTISVRLLRAGERAILTVDDNGRGKAEFQAIEAFGSDTDDAATADSLSVGLAVSEWLARQQEGALTLAPRPAGGTRVLLAVPAASIATALRV